MNDDRDYYSRGDGEREREINITSMANINLYSTQYP